MSWFKRRTDSRASQRSSDTGSLNSEGMVIEQRTRRDTDPDTCLEVFRNHWEQAYLVISRDANNASTSTADEIEAVRQNFEQMVTLLVEEEGEEGQGMPGPILHYLLEHEILEKFCGWCHRNNNETSKLTREQLRMFEHLISQSRQLLLIHKPVIRPLLNLLAFCSDDVGNTDIENSLVLILHQICISISKEKVILESFFNTNADHGPTKFLIFSLLISFLHREGTIGQQARDALLLIMALSSKHPYIGEYIAENSDFCPVLATGLSGLYSDLPRKIEIPSEDWFHITDDDVANMREMSMFLNSLEFCNAVAQIAHPLVRDQLIKFIYNGFLVPVLGPALHQDVSGLPTPLLDSPMFSNSREEVITATAYLDLFLRKITEPALIKAFLKFIFTEKNDEIVILDSLITRINSSSKLSLVSLSLFYTLVDLNCEDVMFDLVFKHLIPCTHVMAPVGESGVEPVLERYESALLMIVGFGGFSIILALIHNAVRKHVFHDEHNLDTTFDAGGNVSLSLTAVTVASQLIWPGDILHSATLTAKNGIAGPFWYAVGIIFNIFIFPIFSVQFKTRAPGAKTYLQVIHARFGRNAHMVFCCFALVTNLVITIGILLAGRATIQSLTKDASDEFTLLTMAVLFGSYSLIGGLGTTFYVSYFNACLVFILLIVFVVKIWHNTDEDHETIGNAEKMFEAISCIHGPEENYGYSYLTFRSGVALLFGVIEVFVSSAVTYCDQASWQSRIAAKPTQGVYGFLLGGLMWFAIPSTMATTTGLAYLSLSAENGTHHLTEGQIDEGLVTPLIAETVLGSAGGILVLTMGAMALMSTGSGEVMAMSSIIVYDIYQTYIRPFRRGLTEIDCVLCGKRKKDVIKKKVKSNANSARDRCDCPDVTRCQPCEDDMKARSKKSVSFWTILRSNAKGREKLQAEHSNGIKPPYTCPTHGRYREYQDSLIGFKDWCIVMVTISIIPLGLIVFETGIDLNWIFYSGAIITIPCFPPVILSIIWVKATGKGLISGGIAGLICGITATLVAASRYEGGLGKFLENTVENYAILAGTCSSFGASLIGCITISLCTHEIKNDYDEDLEWQKMYDIENPLNPWEVNYRDELKGLQYDGKPTFEQMAATFRKAKLTAYIGGAGCITLFALIIPGIMATFPQMDQTQFSFWIWGTQIFAVVMGLIVIIAPMAEEINKIMTEYRKSTRQMNGGYGHMDAIILEKVDGESDGKTPVTNV